MLRPATPRLIERLRCALDASDRELDAALTGLGVLPPLDLGSIRAWLATDRAVLRATQNADGHRIIEIVVDDEVVARIMHDGAIRADGAPPHRQRVLLSA